MKKLLVVATMFLAQLSYAEVYQCKENGSTVFRDKPCAGSKELNNKVNQARSNEQARQDAKLKRQREDASKVEPRIGMTKADAEKSTWGYPDKVNVTTTASSKFEQWVYRNRYQTKYLHFIDGRVTSISE